MGTTEAPQGLKVIRKTVKSASRGLALKFIQERGGNR